MKLFIRLILLFLLLSAFFSPLKGQVYPFHNLTVDEGLSQPALLSIEQDKDGAIWIGTSNGGINKFNGSTFEYLTIKDSLPDNIIYCITKDQSGKLWIGTNNGLSIYDGYSFTNYTTKDGLKHDRVYHVFFDKDNTAWIGTGQGVSIFKNGELNPYTRFEALNEALVINTFQDKDETIWFSTLSHGLFKLSNNKLQNYNMQNGLASIYVYSVNEDTKGNLYVFGHKGIFRFNNNELVELLPNYFNDAVSYYGAETDQFGDFWIASSRGVLKYRNDKFTLYKTENGLVNNDIWKIFRDKENNLWFISKSNGLSKLRSERFYKYDPSKLPKPVVSSLYQNPNGNLLIGTAGGLVIDRGNETTLITDKNGLPSDNVLNILDDGETTWVATNFGIAYIKNGKYTEVNIGEHINFKKCYKIYKDQNNQIWFATYAGLAKFDNGDLVPYKTEAITSSTIFDITEDNIGNFWLATDEGLIRYNGVSAKRYTEKEGIKKGRIRTIINRDNILWIGSPSGLYQFDGKKIKRYSVKDGLPSEDIYSLIFDQEGNLWAGLSIGVVKMIIEDNQVTSYQHYGLEEGFSSTVCYLNCVEKNDKNQLFFGTDNGLIVYQPAYDVPNRFEAKTKIVDIRLFSQNTLWTDYCDSVSLDNMPIDLELDYDKNYLEFNFIGVSHTNSTKIRYQYKLKGIDKGWVKPTDQTQVIYSNLPHGDYEFLLKASNGEGLWNSQPVSFKFAIRPPFWLTWWFFTICILIILSGIYSYVKIKAANKQILEKNKIIEEKNMDIMDSINYAQKIQQAILPPNNLLDNVFNDHFVFYRPKDIVSGDFYWMKEKDDQVLIAVVDCTGHGVPGAFVSIVGHTGLNRAINEYHLIKPGDILDKLNYLLGETLNQAKDNQVKDGMDIALCLLDKKKNELTFSGANNPLYVIRKEKTLLKDNVEILPTHTSKDFSLYEIKADKQPIGLFEYRKEFTNHNIKLQKGDSIYIFSDGYPDQFGGPKGKKFRYKQFRELLFSIQSSPMDQQEDELAKRINNWMGDIEQVDDICVIGIKI